MKPELILVSGGGHCRSCIDVIEQEGKYQVRGIVDIPEKVGQKILGYEIIGTDEELPDLVRNYHYFFITIGQIKSPGKRIALFEQLIRLGARFPTCISPHAYISRHAAIGEGSIIMHGAIVNAGARVGKNCIINTLSLIEHDAIVEDYCHISTSAIVNGSVKVGQGSFIGSNAVLKEAIEIGENSVVSAGLRIMHNLPQKNFKKP